MISSNSKMLTTTRSELHKLFIKKLTAKYGNGASGTGVKDQPMNKVIEAEVGLFMHNHRRISKDDLAELEEKIKTVTLESQKGLADATRPQSAGCRSTSRDSLQDVDSNRSKPRHDTVPKKPRPSTAKSLRKIYEARRQPGCSNPRGARVPSNIKNEWLILETYQQLQREEKQAEDARKVQAAMRQYKLDLEVQIEQNRLRAQQERAEQKARVQEQRKVVTEYVTEQATLKKTAKQKQLEERCALAAQMLENDRRKARERRTKQMDDERVLAECRQQLEADKEIQLRKRQEVADSLRAMRRENEAKQLVRDQERLLEAKEDRRLMREYQERIDREQAERAAAHRRRMERYETIGAHWAEAGAGKYQRETDLAEERRILAEATTKEKADEERERRDKDTLRRNRDLCSRDNRRLMKEKLAQRKVEQEEEAKYARQFRVDGETHAAQGIDRKRAFVEKQKAYACILQEQMRADRASRAAVEMTETERAINSSILRRLREDTTLQDQTSKRLLQKREPVRKKLAARQDAATGSKSVHS